MNKKFLSAILFGALMVTSTGTFVSCKDYDDDIENLQGQISANASAIAELKALIGDGNYVTSISVNGQNLVVNTKNGSTNVALPACEGGSLAEVKDGELYIDGEATGIKVADGEAVKIENGEWTILQADGTYKSTNIPASGVTVTGDKQNGYVLTITDAEGEDTVIELPTAASLITSIDVVGDPFAKVVVKRAVFSKPSSWAGQRELPSNKSNVYGVNSLNVRIDPVAAPAEDVDFYLTNTKNHTLSNLKFFAAATQDSNAGAMTSGNIAGRAAVTGNGLWTLKMDQFVLDEAAAKAFNKDLADNTGNVVYAVNANKVARSKYNVLVETANAMNLTSVQVVNMANSIAGVVNSANLARKEITVNVGQAYKIDEVAQEDGLMWDMYFSAASETAVETYGIVFDHLNRTFTVTKRPDVVTESTAFDLDVYTLDIKGATGKAKYAVKLSSKIDSALAYDAVEYNLANLNISGASRIFSLPISALKEAMGDNWTTWANSVDLTKTVVEAYEYADFTGKVADITGTSVTGLTYSLRTSNGSTTTNVNDLNNVRFTVAAGNKTYTVDTQYYVKVTFNTNSGKYINHVSVPVMFTAPTVADQFVVKSSYVVDDVIQAYYYDINKKYVELKHYFEKNDADARILLDTDEAIVSASNGQPYTSSNLARVLSALNQMPSLSLISGQPTGAWGQLRDDVKQNTTTGTEVGYGKDLIVEATNDHYDGWMYKTEEQMYYSFKIKLMSPIFEGTITPASGSTIEISANATTGFDVTKDMIIGADYNQNVYNVVPDATGSSVNDLKWSNDQIETVGVVKKGGSANTYIKGEPTIKGQYKDGDDIVPGAINILADPMPSTVETAIIVTVTDKWGYNASKEVSVTIKKN